MEFTHRTTRIIGPIKAGAPIRVLRYRDWMNFEDVLAELGDYSHVIYKEVGGVVSMTDERGSAVYLVQDGNYVITDGTVFVVSEVDTGFEPLSEETVESLLVERFILDHKDDSILLDGTSDTDDYSLGTYRGGLAGYVRATAAELHQLADFIKENIPEPSPIEGHMFIFGSPKHAPVRTVEPLVRDGEFWYDRDNRALTVEDVHENYTDLEVIR